MTKHLPKEIKALARSHTGSALKVLTGVMTNIESPPAARVAAAIAVLDRGWGKPSQAIELSGEVSTKVIRAPAVVDDTQDWANQHVPEQHRTH